MSFILWNCRYSKSVWTGQLWAKLLWGHVLLHKECFQVMQLNLLIMSFQQTEVVNFMSRGNPTSQNSPASGSMDAPKDFLFSAAALTNTVFHTTDIAASSDAVGQSFPKSYRGFAMGNTIITCTKYCMSAVSTKSLGKLLLSWFSVIMNGLELLSTKLIFQVT